MQLLHSKAKIPTMPSGNKSLAVDFGGITKDNVEQLRMINTSSFPVQYNDSFYKDVVDRKDEDLCKFAYWNGFVVGAICARVEPIPEADGAAPGRKRLYIMTLAVLAAYRGRGVGQQLVESVLDHVAENIDTAKYADVDEVTLHVQINNTDAMKFYMEKFGFDKGKMVENYYRRIDPPHCYILSKKLR